MTPTLPSAVYATRPADHLSAGYGFIPTIDIVEAFHADGWDVTRASTGKVRKPEREGLQKHLLRFARREDILNDAIKNRLEVVLVNGHDGSSAVRLTAGIFRMACANGIVISTSTVADVRLGHHRLSMDTVLNAGHQLLGQTTRVNDVIDQWKTIGVSYDDARHLAEQGAVLRWGKDLDAHPVTPELLLNVRREEDKELNLWNVFNRVQENVVKGGQKAAKVNPLTNKPFRATRGIRNLQADMVINTGLWEAATELSQRANFAG